MKTPILTLKRILLILLPAATAYATVNVIPLPNHLAERPGTRKLSWPVQPEDITFINDEAHADEAYTLSISQTGVCVEASSDSGRFYAAQTLKQLVLLSSDGTVPCLDIEDAPRYGWRGFMLDESRHFFGKEKVKQLLDQMALYKLNRFHWHLTDSDGWRIEIKKYPRLTEVGAVGNRTDRNAPARFYTQDDIQEIVKYASDRFITIIPEIDMPGHAAAAARSYPGISGGGSGKHPDFTFNPGSEDTYRFLTDVLTEVAALFPSPWIHYGGDEVHFASRQWLELPEVKALMARENLETLKDVERYFNRRMANVIDGLGRKTAAWDEVVAADLDPAKTLVMWWRHDREDVLSAAFRQGFSVVLCPRIPCYFDFVQDDSHSVGRRWDGFSSLDRVYAFPAGLNVAESQVRGIQANLWTERIATGRRLDFMTFPRLQALSEAAWTRAENKEYEPFLERLKVHLPLMDSSGLYYFNPFDLHQHREPEK